MLTRINSTAVWSTLRIPQLVNEIPPMFVAEHLRAAATVLYSGEPLTTQRLVGAVEPKLRPLGYRRHSLADECFGADTSSICSIADAISTLVDVGDFIRVAGGAYYPADSRCVRLTSDVVLIASGLPTVVLSQKRLKVTVPALTRITNETPSHIPEQSLSSWLGIRSLDYGRFANEKFCHPRSPYNSSAQDWMFYDAGIGLWRDVRESPVSKLVTVCRFKPDGISNFQYGIADLRKEFSTVSCVAFFEIGAVDARRVICGLHIDSGTRRDLVFKKRNDWWVTNITHYALPELLKVLRAISADAESKPDKRTEFWISERLESSLDGIISVFGRKPVFRS
jgi:hypothetical protein